ncbi:hypothetical protein J8L13_15640 [Bacteroides fragilis]|uniref:hypothetical protein n=1 Tax=Bacteroides fragilis TaxID=817 RepID=UPI00202E2879|nr:hypothetical protein [Bacteroides fragilis]MCM0238823.1 hypothetical protein [Bacteroides fragilis]
MYKYYFILHSRENGTWMITPSFPTGDYVSSFVDGLKQDGIRIYDYDIYSEETRPMAEKSLQHAKEFYDRIFQFTIQGEQIEVTPLEMLQYYPNFHARNEHRYAKMVAAHKFADKDCTETADEKVIEGILECGDFKEGESVRFKLPFFDDIWNVYIIRRKEKYQVRAYQSGSTASRTNYAHTKDEAVLYCLNGLSKEQFKNR